MEKLILALMETPYEYLAQELEKAMKGIGTNEDVLTEVHIELANAHALLINARTCPICFCISQNALMPRAWA
jgi:annexin-like protein